MILLALALAPVVAIASFIYLKDKYDKEPLKHLFISFILGCVSTIPVFILETSFGSLYPQNTFNTINNLIWAFLIVAGSEELCKFVMLKFYAFKQKDFNEPFDGIIYGVMVSLGFAALENVLYVFEGGVSVAIMRMFTAVPAHASFGVVMGYYFGLAWVDKENALQHKIRGLLVAIILHGVYDFFLFQENYPAFAIFSLLGLIISIRLSFKAIKAHQTASPFHPDKLKKKDSEILDDLN